MLDSVVLLAGFSTRMGQLKQHVKLGHTTFLQMIIEKLQSNDGQLHKKFFVGQQNDMTAQKLVKAVGGIWLSNKNPEDGPLSSIRLALTEIDAQSAFLLWPTDHPMIAGKTVALLINEWQKNTQQIVVPSDGKRRGHPTIFPAWCRQEFYDIGLEDGARKILQMHPEKILHVLTDDSWTLKNLNTPAMLEEARLWLSQNHQINQPQ